VQTELRAVQFYGHAVEIRGTIGGELAGRGARDFHGPEDHEQEGS